MDAYEATKIVFSRIQAMDPDNAAKIMGLLLIQDHGEKEMIRLAFGPEALVQSVVLKARKDLGLLPPSTPSTPSSPSPFSRQNSASSRLGGLPSPSSWAAPPVFSRSNSVNNGNGASLLSNGVVDDLSTDDLIGGGGAANGGANLGGSASPAPFYGNGDMMDDFQLQDQLSFLNDPSMGAAGTGSSPNSSLHGLMGGVNHSANGDLFYSDLSSECRSPSSNGGGDILFPYGGAWGMSNGHHHRSRSCSMADLYLNSDAAAGGFGGWKPCLYYARGYCKNGSSCRFQHGLGDDSAAAVAAAIAGGKMDAVVEQQCQELLLRSKSQQQRIGASQLMASAAPFPYASSPTSAGKCMNFLLQHQQQQQQQSENQRAAAAAAAAAALMLGGGGDDMQQHKFFGGRSRMMADYAAGMANPGSRQIYLTFPADSTFREEDVSNYFSIYGPVQDVRIPYQQKRMFGFVTFVYPETVKIILAKGNPHFVCDARVLVKPYKEKGKIPDKKHQQQQQLDRGDFSGCSTPTGLDSRDPYDLQQLGSRMLFNVNQEALLRRKLEEQQQAAELQQAIELQSRRFMLLDLKNSSCRSLSLPVTCPSPINTGPPTPITTITTSAAPPPAAATAITTTPSQDGSPTATATTEDKCPSPIATELAQQGAVNPITAASVTAAAAAATAAAEKEESAPAAAIAAAGKGSPDGDGDFQESAEHNLPDSPFASPTKSCFTGAGEAFSEAADAVNPTSRLVANANNINGGNNHLMGSSASLFSPPLDLRSYKSCFLQMPRFSSGHGAVGL